MLFWAIKSAGGRLRLRALVQWFFFLVVIVPLSTWDLILSSAGDMQQPMASFRCAVPGAVLVHRPATNHVCRLRVPHRHRTLSMLCVSRATQHRSTTKSRLYPPLIFAWVVPSLGGPRGDDAFCTPGASAGTRTVPGATWAVAAPLGAWRWSYPMAASGKKGGKVVVPGGRLGDLEMP